MTSRGSPQRSIAEAMRWVHRITNVGISCVVPMLMGFGLDKWLHTNPWCLLVGVCVGMPIGAWQLFDLVRSANAESRDKSSR